MKHFVFALLLLTLAIPARAQQSHTLPKGMELGYALNWATHRWGIMIMSDKNVDMTEKLAAPVHISKDDNIASGLLKILPAKYAFHKMEDSDVIRVTLTPEVPNGTTIGVPVQQVPPPATPPRVTTASKRPSTPPQSYSMDEIYGTRQTPPPAEAGNKTETTSPPNQFPDLQSPPAQVVQAGSPCGNYVELAGCSISYGNGPAINYDRVGTVQNNGRLVPVFAPTPSRPAYSGYYGWGGYGYPAQSYYSGYGGWYGLPLFDFQIQELASRYHDKRHTAAIKFKGGLGCDSGCMKNIHVLAVINGQEYYLGGAARSNNWFENPLMVPLDENNTVDLVIIREQAGVMRGFERRMWLPSRAMTKDAMPVSLDQSMFDSARELKILQQHIAVETEPGKYETRGGAAGLPVEK